MPAGQNELLRAAGLTRSFYGYPAVKGVSFAVREGEVVALTGPNGSGKTTLLNLLGGLLRPQEGKIYWGSREITRLDAHRRARLGIARTFQLTRPFCHLTVYENVLVALTARRWHQTRADRERARMILEETGLLDRRHMPANQLSSGALKRLELARALATSPRLLLLDEPFAALSIKEEAGLLELLRRVNERGVAILLVSHNPRILSNLAHRILYMERGRLKGEFDRGQVPQILREGMEL
ncbi:ATP-binding cassette domain-containing protein [Desulfovirgula thermocuniculi]|uniref:ATP-binding cassette domain-containing protein n=1 Tax=Desulfovirgula thermocuniculi TaxID=348842 RepID=UPI000401ABF0|nr:ATP-binding cassette domain-containing protein [Desulfovirgula thermocuniculi]